MSHVGPGAQGSGDLVPGAVIREAMELTNAARLDLPSTAICTGYTSEQYKDATYGFLRGFTKPRNVTWGRPVHEPLADVVTPTKSSPRSSRRRQRRSRRLTDTSTLTWT